MFGEHRFCPVCGLSSPLDTALDALSAELKRLDLLADLPGEILDSVREQGVLDRTFVDTLENVVAVVEAAAERLFRARVQDADQVLKGRGKPCRDSTTWPSCSWRTHQLT